MCTILVKKLKKQTKIGWKVARVTKDNRVISYYKAFTWRKGETRTACTDSHTAQQDQDATLFHCFSRREDARNFKRNGQLVQIRNTKDANERNKLKIIKLVLSGNVYEGITSGMSAHLANNKKAVCGSKAYWDGEFHT